MKSATAIEMQESATLNAGHGSANRIWRLKRRKSITCPYRRRSVRFPRIPASSSASERSRHRSGWLCLTSRTVTMTSATTEIMTKKVLLPLKEDGNYDEESIVAPERSKRCAGIRNIHQTEEIRYDNARLKRADQLQDQPFCQLIQRVERQ